MKQKLFSLSELAGILKGPRSAEELIQDCRENESRFDERKRIGAGKGSAGGRVRKN